MFAPEDYMLPCLNKKLLGIDCMGCGLQRSIVLIFSGNFVEAFNMYPPIYPLLILLLFLIIDFFLNIKYSEVIKISLVCITFLTILINFTLKFF